MKRFILILSVLLPCVVLYKFHTKTTKIPLPKGELRWSTTKPKRAKICVPAAFTSTNNKVIGSYRIKGKSYKTNNKYKVSLNNNTFSINKSWTSSNGFQQLILVRNNKSYRFKSSDRSIRRALCKNGNETFILESNYPMTMTAFAYYCNKRCSDAVYLDMGEYGYGYVRYGLIKIPLHFIGFICKYKQTNWLYIV